MPSVRPSFATRLITWTLTPPTDCCASRVGARLKLLLLILGGGRVEHLPASEAKDAGESPSARAINAALQRMTGALRSGDALSMG